MTENRDPIKDFVQQNKEAFNDASLPEKLWVGIENQLDLEKGPGEKDAKNISLSMRIWKITSIAAIGLLLVAIGVILGITSGQNNYTSPQYTNYQEQEKIYSTLVNARLEEVKNYNADESVASDIEQLDEVYEELKYELMNGENPNKEIIIDAMIVNYETKVAILERVLQSLRDSENEKKTKSENDEI